MRLSCNFCKKEIERQKYFELSIYQVPYRTQHASLRLRLCSYGCLKKIVDEPELIIIDLL